MKNKTLGIFGCIVMLVAVAAGYFWNFPAELPIKIAVAAFGLTMIIKSVISDAKEKKNFSWKTVVIVVLSCVSGVLVCLGGLSQNIFAEISGATLALLAVIFGLKYGKK